jgi:RNA polymerase sigma factor (sigma-70 family)
MSAAPAHDRFLTTQWSMVLAAGGSAPDDATQASALATLCELYWYPLYAFVRRRGYDPDAAQDLTQAFFARVIEKSYLRTASPERGRFRSFLLGSLKHFLANEWDHARARKRGGGHIVLPLDVELGDGENRYRLEPVDDETPEHLFERQWALALLARVLARLREEHEQAGKVAQFDVLKPILTGEPIDETYAQLGERLGMSDGAVKVAVHRLRRRMRVLLEEEIARTVADPREADDELRHLFEVLS